MTELKPGDIWHKTAGTEIKYEPDGKAYDDKVMKIYKKEKEDDRTDNERIPDSVRDSTTKW